MPIEGVQVHSNFDPEFGMYVFVGHSLGLKDVMNDKLKEEIGRGLWWFMLSLVGGVAICFVIFATYFQRRLQIRVT